MPVQSLGREDPLEEETAPHSSILAREIPWTEKTGTLQSMGLQKNWTSLSDYQQQMWVSMVQNYSAVIRWCGALERTSLSSQVHLSFYLNSTTYLLQRYKASYYI